MINDGLTGEKLAEMLLKALRNEHMKTAIRLLGADRDGYWLRRLLDDEELNAASEVALIDRRGRPPRGRDDSATPGGLARPVGPDEADHLSRGYDQVKAGEHRVAVMRSPTERGRSRAVRDHLILD